MRQKALLIADPEEIDPPDWPADPLEEPGGIGEWARMIEGTAYRLGDYWTVPAHVYLLLRRVAARKITDQVVWAYIDHTRRELDEAERRAHAAAAQQPVADEGWGG